MKDEQKTREQLLNKLVEMRQRVAELEAADAEHKQAEKAVREREELFRSLMENTYFGITLVDVNYKILMVNTAISRNFCKPVGEFIGRECFREFEKRESVCPHCPGIRAMATGQSVEVETEGVRDDGGRFSVRIQAFPVIGLDDAVTGFIEIVEDITERQLAEQALMNERNLLRTLIDNLPDYIYAKDTESRFVLGNIAAACEVGVTTPDEMLGKTDFDFFSEELAAQYYADERAIIESGQPLINREEPVIDHAGNRLWVLTTKVPLRDSQGQIVGLVGMNHDITERKRAEEEIQQRTAQLEALREVELELTAQLDLDTLLRSIVSRAVELLGGFSGTLDLYRPDRDVLEWVVSVGLDHPPAKPLLRRGEGLCGKVWETGELLIVDDYHRWEGRRPGWECYPFQAAIGVPVRWGKEFLGVLEVDAVPPRAFSQADAELLSLFATQAAIAIRNARLYEEARRRAERLAVVNHIARAASATLHLDDLMETVYREVTSVFEADAFFIALYDAETKELDYRLQVDEGIREPRERRPLGTGLTSVVVTERKPLLIRDMERERDRLPTPHVWGTMKLPTSWLGVPMLIGERLIGVICVQTYRPRAYGEEEQLLLSTIADQVAITIENARLFEEEKKRATQLALINEVGDKAASILDLDRLMQEVTRSIQESFNYYNVILGLVDEECRQVVVQAIAGGYEHLAPGEYRQSIDEGIMGFVVRTGQSWLAGDVSKDPYYIKGFLGEVLTRSELGVPIKLGDQVIGLLDLQSIFLNDFDQADVVAMEAVADRLAIAMENARLFQETRQRALQLQTVEEVGRKVSAILDPGELFPYVVRAIQQNFSYYHVDIFLADQVTGYVVFKASSDPATGKAWEKQGLRFKIGEEGMVSWVAYTGEPLLANDVSQEPHYLPDDLLPETKSELVVPLKVGDQVVGVLDVNSNVLNAFDQDDLFVLQTLANQIAIAIENAQLHQETQDRSRYLETLQRINATLRSTLPLSQVLETVAQGTSEALNYVGTLIAVPDAAGKLLTVGAVWGGRFLDTVLKLTGVRLNAFRLPVTAEENAIVRAYLSGELQTTSGEPERIVVSLEPAVSLKLAWLIRQAVGAELAVCVPLPVGQKVVGVLVVFSPRKQLPDEERAMLLGLADQAGLAIENTRLFEDTRRHHEQLAALNTIAMAVTGTLHLREVLQTIQGRVMELLGEKHPPVFALFNERDETFEVVVTHVRPRVLRTTERLLRIRFGELVFPLSGLKPALREALLAGKPYVTDDGTDILGTRTGRLLVKGAQRAMGVRCIVDLPLWAKGKLVGSMVLLSQKGMIPDEEMELLSAIAGQAAIAVENARLYEAEQRRRRDAEALRETALALTSALDRNQVVERILSQLQQVVPYDSASVQLLQGDRLVITGGRGFPNLKDLLGLSFPVEGDNPNREVMRTRAPFIVEDAPAVYEVFRKSPHIQAVIRSWLGVPMLIGERVVGMIALDKREPRFYTEEHARLAQTFAAQAAVAVENARLFEEVEKRRLYLEGVLGAAPDAIVTLDAHDRIVEWNPGAERLFGYSQEEVIGRNIDDLVTGPDVLAEAIEFTRVVMGGLEVRPVEAVRYRKDGSPVDVIVAGSPILVGDELIGAVVVYTDITRRKRMEEELRALLLVDELTGLYNRRGFLTLGQQQLRMANRMKRRMLLLFADFDHLKQINDTFGHPEGDRALIEVAHVFQETFRESDIIARIAGDEFVILALETIDDSAEILATRLQKNVAARNARGDLRFELSLSVGVACYDPEAPCPIDDLVAQADRAMYEQKRGEQKG